MADLHPELFTHGNFRHLKLGRSAPRHDPRTLKLAKYLDKPALPPVPATVDYTTKVPAWGMMDNDQYGCHDEKTEVLTEYGWQLWPDYDGSSMLGTYNTITGHLEFQMPSALQRYDYNGPIYYPDHKGLDFALTPEHRMFHRPYLIPNPYVKGMAGYGDWRFSTIQDMAKRVAIPGCTSGWSGADIKQLKIGRRLMSGDDFVQLVSLLLSDGWVGGSSSTWNVLSFCCFRPDRVDLVASLAQRLGISETARSGVWRFQDGEFADWMRANCFTSDRYTSGFKRIPDIVKCASQDQIDLFLNAYGDQHIDPSYGRQFYSSSKRMIDDLQELLLRIGKRGSIYTRPPRNGGRNEYGKRIETRLTSYTLNEWDSSQVTLQRSHGKWQVEVGEYKGEIFCATVPNSTLVTRRSGKILISGNCCTASAAGHMVQAWTANAGKEVVPDDNDVLNLYWATGNPPNHPCSPGGPTDTGRVELDVLKAWQKTGLGADRIVAFVQVNPKDLDEVRAALYLFGGLYLGIALPVTAQHQQVWDVVGDGKTGDSSPGSWGGHAVNAEAFDQDGFTVITWGAPLRMTAAFWDAYVDEAWAVLSSDWLTAQGTSIAGFDLAQLQADLAAVSA